MYAPNKCRYFNAKENGPATIVKSQAQFVMAATRTFQIIS